jgi:hypothetical protein
MPMKLKDRAEYKRMALERSRGADDWQGPEGFTWLLVMISVLCVLVWIAAMDRLQMTHVAQSPPQTGQGLHGIQLAP